MLAAQPKVFWGKYGLVTVVVNDNGVKAIAETPPLSKTAASAQAVMIEKVLLLEEVI